VIKKLLRILKNDGPIVLMIKILLKIQKIVHSKKNKVVSMVAQADLFDADWVNKPFHPQPLDKKPGYSVAWVMSPPGKSSGGHQNIFRFMKFMEEAGHTCTIYLYSTQHPKDISEINEDIKESYPKLAAKMIWIKSGKDIPAHDAIFATGWETAYPVYSAPAKRKFYFVQDFEPYFYSVGSDYILAENTYRFGFYGITAGGWLSKKLREEYGMETAHFDFSADSSLYTRTNDDVRRDVCFYARPVTSRRAFELGVYTLTLFAEMNPKSTIHMLGWDVSDYDLPFNCINHGSMSISDLPPIYNKCAAGLVLSLTNMSLLPLELLSCGVIPIVNDADNNRLVSNNPNIRYAQPSPLELATALSDIVNRADQVKLSRKAADSMSGASWDGSGEAFIKTFDGAMR
jgi:hypothetical protein